MRRARSANPTRASVAAAIADEISQPRTYSTPRRLKVSLALQAQRELFIEEMVIMQMPVGRIVTLANRPTGPLNDTGRLAADNRPPGLGMTREAIRKLIELVVDKLQRQFEGQRPHNKPNAEQRLFRHIRDARSRGQYGAVIGAERLLADIQGTRAPIKIDVNISLQSALINVLGSMPASAMNELLDEYNELEAKANDGSTVFVQTKKPEVYGRIYEVKGLAADYLVSDIAGVVSCTCPDFQFRGHERPCKHVLLVNGSK